MDTFLCVCKHMSFTDAAEELCITQPAVTQHIRFLERNYGVKLFDRRGRGIELTKAGQMLKNAATTMMNDERYLKDSMIEAQSNRSYIFGATLTVAEYMIAEPLTRFISNHEGSRIEMKVANTTQLLEQLDSGDIDFAIVEGNFPKSEYESLSFAKKEYVAVGSPRLALEYRGRVLDDLLSQTLISREEGSGSREILERELSSRGHSIQDFGNMIELGSIGLIKKMVQMDLGITFLYRDAIFENELAGNMAVIDIKDFDVYHEIAFIFRKNSVFRDDYLKIFSEFVDC